MRYGSMQYETHIVRICGNGDHFIHIPGFLNCMFTGMIGWHGFSVIVRKKSIGRKRNDVT